MSTYTRKLLTSPGVPTNVQTSEVGGPKVQLGAVVRRPRQQGLDGMGTNLVAPRTYTQIHILFGIYNMIIWGIQKMPKTNKFENPKTQTFPKPPNPIIGVRAY